MGLGQVDTQQPAAHSWTGTDHPPYLDWSLQRMSLNTDGQSFNLVVLHHTLTWQNKCIATTVSKLKLNNKPALVKKCQEQWSIFSIRRRLAQAHAIAHYHPRLSLGALHGATRRAICMSRIAQITVTSRMITCHIARDKTMSASDASVEVTQSMLICSFNMHIDFVSILTISLSKLSASASSYERNKFSE